MLLMRLLSWLVALAVLPGVPVAGQVPVPTRATVDLPAGATVAWVNLQVVLAKSKLGQQGAADLQKLSDERDADLAARQKAIADLEARISGPQQPALSVDQVSALTRELSHKRAQLIFEEETWEIRLEQFSQEMLGNFRAQMLPVLDEIRDALGLRLVLSLPHPGVIAADPRLDLSQVLVRRLDERTK